MADYTNEFKSILVKIESALKQALPETPDQEWNKASFGTIFEGTTNAHIQNLIDPNKDLISLGGKRWRPLLLILCYQMAKEQHPDKALDESLVYSITPLVEFVHTASLIHDDIEDSSDLRRGKPAAYITFGLDTALNAGSWLYFEAPVCINKLQISDEQKLRLYKVYTNELRRLHLGQAMDIYWHRNPGVFPSKVEYEAMVKYKTGTLASLAAKIGCIAGGMSIEEADIYGEIAANLGKGFQIIDDVINLTTGNAGKKRGDDIVEGKKSLPVLTHIEKNPDDKIKIADFMEKAAKEGINSPAVEDCIKLLENSNSISKAAKDGTDSIYEYSKKFNSDKIVSLFVSMIPKDFR